jgi:hypothetical protein
MRNTCITLMGLRTLQRILMLYVPNMLVIHIVAVDGIQE